MILCYRCPSCKNVHKILLTQKIINDKKFLTMCVNNGKSIMAKIELDITIIPEISKLDYREAEEESKMDSAKWLYEEAIKRDKIEET